MSQPNQGDFDRLPPALAREIDQACNRFECAVRNGDRPDMDAIIASVPEQARSPLREELLKLDSYYRAQRDTPGDPTTDEAVSRPTSVIRAPIIAGYEILAELGRGGMGVVYQARQTSVKRLVALKMILMGEHAGPNQVARFLAESEAVAQLEHPNLVRLYEVGQHNDLPFFTMEFVPGGSLNDKLDGTPLHARTAARLVEQIAQGMHYAHQRGIVHRDLKPANVLLQMADNTDRPMNELGVASEIDNLQSAIPKITDFGLAKDVKTEEGVTATGLVLGTPSYMAPEQAEGKAKEAGPAVDIYALGAILYHCLTGRPPFRGPTSMDTIRQVIAAEPVQPARLNPMVPRDLDTICLKCLQKDPRKRYADAGELAEDLQRFQAGEPIRARPTSAAERVFRWVRKRPATAALLTLLTLILVGGVAGLFVYQQQRLASLLHQQGVDEEIAHALDDAEKLPEDIYGKLADPVRFAEVRSDIESWKTTLDRARAAWDRADRLAAANPEVLDPALLTRVQAVALQRDSDESDWRLAKRLDDIQLGASLLITGHFDPTNADPNYAEFFKQLGFDFDKGDPADMAERVRKHRLRFVLVAALDHWGEVLDQSDPSEAVARHMPRVLRTARLADPNPWRDQVRDPVNWKDRELLATLAQNVDFFRQSPQVVLLLSVHFGPRSQERVTLLRNALLHHPRDFWLNCGLGEATRDPAEQAGCYRAALAIRPVSSMAYNNLGNALDDMKDTEGAISHYEKAIALDGTYSVGYLNLGVAYHKNKNLDACLRQYKKAIDVNPRQAISHYYLGIALRDSKDPDGAIRAYEQAIRLKPNYSEAHYNLGVLLYEDKNDRKGAIRHYELAIKFNPQDTKAHGMLGNALLDMNDLAGAIREYRELIAIDPKDPGGHGNLGNALHRQKELKEAIHHLKEAIALAPDDPTYHFNLGNVLVDNKEYDAAIEHYKKAIAHKEKDDANSHIGLGTALSRKNEWTEAMVHFKKAVAIDPKSAEAHFKVGRALEVAKDFEGAIVYYEKAIERKEKYADAHSNLGVVLRAIGKLPVAILHLEKAIAIEPKRGDFYRNLGVCLAETKDIQGAKKRYQQAIDLDAKDFEAYYNLGLTYFFEKDYEIAIRNYEKVIALNPGHAQATCNLGHSFRELGEFDKAVKYLSLGHELGSKQAGWPYPSAQWIQHSQQLLALDRKLSAALRGDAPQPAGWQEQFAFADICRHYKRQYAAAAQFYAEGLKANPKIADNPEIQVRFLAATCAARAAAGEGKDAAKLDDQARAKLRRDALGWLQAHLDSCKALASAKSEKDTLAAFLVSRHLGQWLSDASLASIRDDKALAGLPVEEAKRCRQFWSDASELAKKIRARFRETVRQGTLTSTTREETHELKLQSGQIVIIEMTSPQFDTFLRLEDDQTQILAENDDIGPQNLNSRLVFTAPKTALYRVVATSYQQRGRGIYTLTIWNWTK